MKKIIHFSDLHIGYKDLHIRFDQIVENLKVAKGHNEDSIIIITGDLVEDGDENYYRWTKKRIEKLRRELRYKVLVCPGNHDYRFQGKARSKWVVNFKETYFWEEDFGGNNEPYPKLDFDEDENPRIAFIGLDSMEGEIETRGGAGRIGDAQLQRLKDMLETEKVKKCEKVVIYLHHHPLDPIPAHKLKDADEFVKILKNHDVDALLFGHLHHGQIWNGFAGIGRVYDAGSSTNKNGASPHRIIHLSRKPVLDSIDNFHGPYIVKKRFSFYLIDFYLSCFKLNQLSRFHSFQIRRMNRKSMGGHNQRIRKTN